MIIIISSISISILSILIITGSLAVALALCLPGGVASQDSSKGGAVETGCSDLHCIIGCFII